MLACAYYHTEETGRTHSWGEPVSNSSATHLGLNSGLGPQVCYYVVLLRHARTLPATNARLSLTYDHNVQMMDYSCP